MAVIQSTVEDMGEKLRGPTEAAQANAQKQAKAAAVRLPDSIGQGND